MNDKLWRDEDVAEYLGVSMDTVRRKLLCKSTFPKAIQLPTGGTRGALMGKSATDWSQYVKLNSKNPSKQSLVRE